MYQKFLVKNFKIPQVYRSVLKNLSQLGATFNQKPSSHIQQKTRTLDDFKKLLTSTKLSFPSGKTNTGLFGLSELKTLDGFYDLKDKAESRVKDLIQEAFKYEPNNSKRNLVQIFDDISNELCKVADLAEFVRTSHPNVKYRKAANQTFSSICQIVEKLNTNLDLYSKLKKSYEFDPMDERDRRICRLFLIDFEQSGIHLNENIRNQFVQVNDELIDYLNKFQVNSQAPAQAFAKTTDTKFSYL